MSRRWRALYRCWCAWVVCAGCGVEPARTLPAPAPGVQPPAHAQAPSDKGAQRPEQASAAPREPALDLTPVLIVTDPEALAVVADAGGDFGRLVADHGEPVASNAELAASAAYLSIVDAVSADVGAVARRDPAAGVGIRGHAHRLFDLRWLRSRAARFELVAVVNRVDRRALDAPDAACGETRLVYRLAYAQQKGETLLASRLPMTAVAELLGTPRASDPECVAQARAWLAPGGITGAALGAWLVSSEGPLARERLSRLHLRQLALNLQTVRWPSAVRPDLGGHAQYALRALRWDAARGRYLPRKLENTPDVPRLLRDRPLRDALLAWITAPENAARIDLGTAILPDVFLAESVTSVTPRGLARLQNRPFRQLFTAETLAGLPFESLRFARSPEAFLRRLDDASCNGCHQSRSIAGFHLLGEDAASVAAGNALASPLSPHARAELARRTRYVSELARGAPVDDARPFAERADQQDGSYGAHCGLADPGFARWDCAQGLHCDPYEAALGDTSVGVCLPNRPEVGDPCEGGRVLSHPDPLRDRIRPSAAQACAGVCEATAVGFPGGMCAASCDDLPQAGTCGSIAILSDFNNCLARGEAFAHCAASHVRPAGLRACSADAPCRDDYVCARTQAGQGACLPPYFVFQLRVDGHP